MKIINQDPKICTSIKISIIVWHPFHCCYNNLSIFCMINWNIIILVTSILSSKKEVPFVVGIPVADAYPLSAYCRIPLRPPLAGHGDQIACCEWRLYHSQHSCKEYGYFSDSEQVKSTCASSEYVKPHQEVPGTYLIQCRKQTERACINVIALKKW
jgi:hypothetical protein